MKLHKMFLLVILLIFSLTACFQDREESSATKKSPKQEQQSFNINGQFVWTGKWIYVNGKSNLKKGTKVTIELNGKKLTEAVVDEKGEFKVDFNRELVSDKGFLFATVKPTLQSNQLQKVYGEKGEKLGGELSFTYEENGIKASGIRAGMLITSSELDSRRVSFQSEFTKEKILKQD